MPAAVDFTGQRFRMLVAVRRAHNTKQGASAWWCACACGSKKRVYARSVDLRRGDVGSCGCATGRFISEANSKHGLSRTQVYRVWRAMMDRCYNPGVQSYAYCGARGIRVVKRWHVFETFHKDMGARPSGLTLERKRNGRWYSPGNCVWATSTQQANNKRSNRRLRMGGVEKTLSQWAKQYGQPPLRVWQRLHRGWSLKKALSTPAKQ